MGIKGLWKEVAPITRPSHLSEFKGQAVGVDSYCWLHKYAVQSIVQIEETGACDKFIAGFMSRVDLLTRCGVTPVLVFDGRSMPMKAATDAERRSRRRAAREEARALMKQGRAAEAAAMLEKALEVTGEMAYAVIRVAKERGIRCVVAPFEADAQLAFLCRTGVVQCAISEDSDLLVYNCPVLIAKLDSQGACDTVRARDLRSLPAFAGLSYEAFVLLAILSGCDYVANLPGVGIKSAIKAVANGRTMHDAVAGVSRSANLTAREAGFYEEQVHKAFYCFAHHLVYDPKERAIRPINAFPPGVTQRAELIGEALPSEAAVALCETHETDPDTGRPYQDTFATSVDAFWRRVRGAGQRTLADVGVTRSTTETMLIARSTNAFVARCCDREPQPLKQRAAATSKYFTAPGAPASTTDFTVKPPSAGRVGPATRAAGTGSPLLSSPLSQDMASPPQDTPSPPQLASSSPPVNAVLLAQPMAAPTSVPQAQPTTRSPQHSPPMTPLPSPTKASKSAAVTPRSATVTPSAQPVRRVVSVGLAKRALPTTTPPALQRQPVQPSAERSDASTAEPSAAPSREDRLAAFHAYVTRFAR